MKIHKFALVLTPLLITACSKPKACPVWLVLEESHAGTAQRITIAIERAIEANDLFNFANGPGPGTATFVLKRTHLGGNQDEMITLTYEATDPGGGNAIRRTLNCGTEGSDCIPVVMKDLRTQCAIGSSDFIPTDAP